MFHEPIIKDMFVILGGKSPKSRGWERVSKLKAPAFSLGMHNQITTRLTEFMSEHLRCILSKLKGK